MKIKGPINEVDFREHRWRVRIILEVDSGPVEYVADASINSGDGIWFGTAEEHAEAEKDAYGY